MTIYKYHDAMKGRVISITAINLWILYQYVYNFHAYIQINMKNKNGLDKVSQIITISNNYVSHQKNLIKIKGLVDHSNPKRNRDINQYLSRKNTYQQIRRKIVNQKVTEENQKIVQRITNISQRRNDSSRVSTRSNKSLQRTLSDQVSAYKTKRSFIKRKQLNEQNNKMSDRIKNAHFKNGLSPRNYLSSERENKNFKNVHSKFSSRSKDQMKQIFDGLNIDHKKIPFLPVLSSRRYSKHY